MNRTAVPSNSSSKVFWSTAPSTGGGACPSHSGVFASPATAVDRLNCQRRPRPPGRCRTVLIPSTWSLLNFVPVPFSPSQLVRSPDVGESPSTAWAGMNGTIISACPPGAMRARRRVIKSVLNTFFQEPWNRSGGDRRPGPVVLEPDMHPRWASRQNPTCPADRACSHGLFDYARAWGGGKKRNTRRLIANARLPAPFRTVSLGARRRSTFPAAREITPALRLDSESTCGSTGGFSPGRTTAR